MSIHGHLAGYLYRPMISFEKGLPLISIIKDDFNGITEIFHALDLAHPWEADYRRYQWRWDYWIYFVTDMLPESLLPVWTSHYFRENWTSPMSIKLSTVTITNLSRNILHVKLMRRDISVRWVDWSNVEANRRGAGSIAFDMGQVMQRNLSSPMNYQDITDLDTLKFHRRWLSTKAKLFLNLELTLQALIDPNDDHSIPNFASPKSCISIWEYAEAMGIGWNGFHSNCRFMVIWIMMEADCSQQCE